MGRVLVKVEGEFMLRINFRDSAVSPQKQWDHNWIREVARPASRRWTALKSAAKRAAPAKSAVKRSLDFCGAIFFLIALAPVMGLVALLVSLDGGPVFFSHSRIGAGGRPFGCLKFRTMCMDADKRLAELLANDPHAQAEWEKDFKLRNDPRVTKIGGILRKTSLDELPQLFNVLRGEMSLVGPRPIVRAEVSRYQTAYREYLKCRPGLTGLWQVSGRNDVDYAQRVVLDCQYVRSWTVLGDIVILFRTVFVVLQRAGAY
jgi:Undecaprenyl-phosphate galactose phosphotransferase WbaP